MSGNPMDLTGATVLVTGASSGIGRDTAVLLSSLHARLVLTGRNRDRLQETLASLEGQGHRVAPFDFNRPEEIGDWLKSLTADAGPLNGLVHAAGVESISPIRFVRQQDVEEVVRVNLLSSIMLVRAFTQKSCHAVPGSIVFLSSIRGTHGAPSMSVYGATKAALIGLAKSLAVELAPRRIRVNCVAAGCVQTEMLARFRDSFSDEQFRALEQAHPLGFGTARDVAHAVAFLLADTGRWVTGSTMAVDGGYSAQ
jgi:NAD(P)-dependent dehydrogenase (short-subunit alcohol dehydrogenase family)